MGWKAAEATGRAREGIGRRTFLAGGAAGLSLPWLAPARSLSGPSGVPADGKVAFKVMRKGAHIGEHSLTFSQDGDTLTVTTDVRITVHIGPVPVYHHAQHCVERWKGDRFVSLDSTTSSNVSHDVVAARRMPDGVHIEPSSGVSFIAPADALPLTHWNRFAYQGPLFDPEKGKLLKETLVARADDMIPMADGSMVKVTRWSVTGDGMMDDFYDAGGVWAGLHVKVRDGSRVEYLRL
jgi:hypothetical protein